MIKKIAALAVLLFLNVTSHAQTAERRQLTSSLARILHEVDGKVGIGVLGLDFSDTLLMNDEVRYPMQSVYKFQLALAILDKVSAGQLSLRQRVHISRSQMEKDTWSPMLAERKGEEFELTVEELLLYSVSKSDNNACDILFKLAGGPAAVDRFIKQKGIKGMAIKTTEAEMRKGWEVQYTNYCHPSAMLQLLKMFYEDWKAKKPNMDLLMRLMTDSENSDKRIKGKLPKNTLVAHKTGTGGTNAANVRAATNDAGIITLPDGRHYALVVYVADYKGGMEAGEGTIANISRAVWDAYTKPK